jgi:hypothetical protein
LVRLKASDRLVWKVHQTEKVGESQHAINNKRSVHC